MSALTNPAPAPQPPAPPLVPSTPAPASEPAQHEPRRPRNWLWLAGVVVAVGAGWLFHAVSNEQANQQQQAAAQAVRTAKAHVGTVVKTLRVSGQTSARKYANIVAPLLRGPENRNSLILLRLARAGGSVRQGEFLAQIDAQSAQDHIDDVQDIVDAAQSDVSKLDAQQMVEWERLQQNLRVAKSDWDKWKLDNQAAETKTTLDQELLKLGVDEAEARYRQAMFDKDFTKKSEDAQHRILELTVQRHKRHLGRHTGDIKKYTMNAPMDGLVVMQSTFRGGEMQQIQEGDQVWPGMMLLKVVDTRTMQLEGSINQAESTDFRLGMEAAVGLDAFPGVTFKGKVYSIGALATRGSRENYFIRNIPVRIQIQGADPRLIPDLSAYAEVRLASADNAVVVPRAALRQDRGKTYVDLKTGESRWEKREVTPGLANEIEAAIVAGLRQGDEVRLYN